MEDSAKNQRDMNILLQEATKCGIQLLDLQQSLNFWALCRKVEKFRMLQVLELIISICCLILGRMI